MTLKIFLITLVFALALACITIHATLIKHEMAHVSINKNHGSESNFEITLSLTASDGLEWYGETQTGAFPSEEDKRAAYVGHSMNEAVGYQFQPAIFVVVFLLSMGVFYPIFCKLEGDAK